MLIIIPKSYLKIITVPECMDELASSSQKTSFMNTKHKITIMEVKRIFNIRVLLFEVLADQNILAIVFDN